jgi:hypothetical protein
MYSICELVYGIEPSDLMREIFHEKDFEYDEVGFEERYTGSGDETPAFLGVSLFKFDETENTKFSELQENSKPSKKQEKEYRDKYKKFVQKLRDLFKEEGVDESQVQIILDSLPKEPCVFLLWSTS